MTLAKVLFWFAVTGFGFSVVAFMVALYRQSAGHYAWQVRDATVAGWAFLGCAMVLGVLAGIAYTYALAKVFR